MKIKNCNVRNFAHFLFSTSLIKFLPPEVLQRRHPKHFAFHIFSASSNGFFPHLERFCYVSCNTGCLFCSALPLKLRRCDHNALFQVVLRASCFVIGQSPLSLLSSSLPSLLLLPFPKVIYNLFNERFLTENTYWKKQHNTL